MILEVNDNDWRSKTNSGIVLLELGATWCAPCKMQAPILDNIDFLMDNVKVLKLDIDKSPRATQSLGVQSVPTIIIYNNGREVDRFTGLQNKERLIRALKHA